MSHSQIINHPLIAPIIERLRNELPVNLAYHNLAHTLDVIHEVEVLADMSSLSLREKELLLIAAAYHDSGYLFSYENNEKKGAMLAVSAMRRASTYSESEIEFVRKSILETTVINDSNGLMQVPGCPLSAILLDADMANFGRDDFIEKTELLIKELGVNAEAFRLQAREIIKNHRWHSTAGHERFSAGQAANIKRCC
ncbi:MAG: HD domain-containing protein [bacterium]|nr:HD domain-containing protein [bacterium]